MFVTTMISFALIAGGAVVITLCRMQSAAMASTAITIFNQLTPRVVRILTSYESHPDQSSYSASKYIKMTVFRWMNTAVIFSIITPFTDTLQNGPYLIDSVFTMFLFDLILTPFLGLTDIFGNLYRHCFGPRAASQRQMNLYFKASSYDIGEMETNITRIFFFTLYYCTIFPAGFFLASAIFFFAYWVDRFSILRSWGQGPQVSGTISMFSSNFFMLSLLFYAVMATYQIASFPSDNACPSGEDVKNYVGEYSLTMNDGIQFMTEITEDDRVFKFCQQSLMRYGAFPLTSVNWKSEFNWMNSSQQKFSPLYGWTMVATIVLVIIAVVFRNLYKIFKVLFYTQKVSLILCDKHFIHFLQPFVQFHNHCIN